MAKQNPLCLLEAAGSRLLDVNGIESTRKEVNTGTTLVQEDILKEVIFEFCEPRKKMVDNELGRKQII